MRKLASKQVRKLESKQVGRLADYCGFVSLILVIFIIFITSCDLDTPPAPVHDNPWDPENPNPPRAPVELNGSAISEIEIQLNWTDMSGNEDGFYIFESPSTDSFFTIVDTMEPNADSLILTGRDPVTIYHYKIEAFNDSGSSSQTDTISVNTAETQPTAPLELEARTVSATEIELTWHDQSFNENHFTIEESISDSLQFEPIIEVTSNSTYLILIDREPFVTSYYRIAAVNDYGLSAHSNVTWATPGDFPPATPINMTARATSEIEIELTWIDQADNEEQFEIFISEENEQNFEALTNTAANDIIEVFSECESGKDYFFKVRARNRYGTSEFSNVCHASTRDAPPVAPADLRAEVISETDIELFWTDLSVIEEGYQVQESIDGPEHFSEITVTEPNVENFQVNDLIPLTTYYYRIRTVGANCFSEWSDVISVIPGSIPPDAPGNLTAEAVSMTEIDLTWEDHSTNEESFEIQESRQTQGNWNTLTTMPADRESTRLYSKTSGTRYFYRIRAVNQYGNSSFSNIAETTTPTLPENPSSLSANGVTSDEIHITWRDRSDNEDGFYVEESVGDDGNFTQIDQTETDVYEVTISGCEQFTTYYYRVRAFNEYGVSRYSNIDSATPYTVVVFAAAGDAGLIAVNINDPEAPEQLCTQDTPGYARHVEVVGELAYVADSFGGLRIIDISNPMSLSETGYYDTDGRSRSVAVDGIYAYVADETNGLEIVNVSDPSNPTHVGQFDTMGCELHDVSISEANAYTAAASGGLMVWDVSSPDSPRIIATEETPGASYGVDVVGDIAYVADYSAGLRVYDVSTPGDPVEIGAQDTPGYALGVTVVGRYAFVADYWEGLRIIDISTPAQPNEVGSIDTPDEAWEVAVLGNIAIVADYDGGLRIMSVENPENPIEVENVQLPGVVTGVAIFEYR